MLLSKETFAAAALLIFIDLVLRGIMLSKTGKKGIAVFVPFIGRIVEFEQYWNILWAIPYIVGLLLSYIFLFVAAYTYVAGTYWKESPYIFGALLAIPAVTYLAMRYHTLKSFGKHSVMFLFELLGLGIVLDGIMAISRCKYIRQES